MTWKSDSIAKLSVALSMAQSNFPVISKTRKAEVKMKSGGTFYYMYADIADVIKDIKEVLAKNSLSFSQLGFAQGDKQYLRTVISHSSGEWFASDLLLPPVQDPQQFGSQMTYYRRYGLTAAVGVASEEDDDAKAVPGQSAQKAAEVSERASQETKQTANRAPECCGAKMYISKYVDNAFGHAPFYCAQCKRKVARE